MIGHINSQIHKQQTIVTLPFEGNPNNLGDSNRNFTTIGTLNYLNEGNNPTGKYSVGPFAVANYVKSPSAVNSLVLSNYNKHSIEIIFKANSIANGPVIFSNRVGAASVYNAMRVLSNGAIRVIIDNAVAGDSAAGLVVPGTWYVYGFTYDGTAGRGYVTRYDGPRKTIPDAITTRTSTATTIDAYIGRSYEAVGGFELPLDGIIAQTRIWGELKTYFPQGA